MKRENVWLVALQYPDVLLMQAPAGKGTCQLPAGNRLKHSLSASLAGTAGLFPENSSLLASSIGTSLETSTNK